MRGDARFWSGGRNSPGLFSPLRSAAQRPSPRKKKKKPRVRGERAEDADEAVALPDATIQLIALISAPPRVRTKPAEPGDAGRQGRGDGGSVPAPPLPPPPLPPPLLAFDFFSLLLFLSPLRVPLNLPPLHHRPLPSLHRPFLTA